MKKLIFTILSLLYLAMMPTPSDAQNRKVSSDKTGFSQNATQSRKFILQGHVDPSIKDSCYNIYMTNFNGNINNEDIVARVPVKNKKFRFETEIDEIMSGRIRALFPGDKLCSAWIDTYFIPGFTLDMTVHNGYYDINNLAEYNAALSEWSYYYPQQPPVFSSQNNVNAKEDEKAARLKVALDAYQDLLDELQHQLQDLRDYNLTTPLRMEESEKLFKKMSRITDSMEKLIDKYVQTIDK